MSRSHLLRSSSLLILVSACGPASTIPSEADSGATRTPDASPTPTHDAAPGGADASGVCSSPFEPGCDCDPTGQVAAYEILVDDLSSDRGHVKPATGFDDGVWSFSDGAYRQQAEMTPGRNDASLVALAEPAGDLLIHVTASSTAATLFEGQDNLRQLFLTARARSSGGEYEAAACGIDLAINSSGTDRRVVAAELSGSPGDVATTLRGSRDNPSQLNFGDEFEIRMVLRGGEMECQVTIPGQDPFFVLTGGFGGSAGAVGFHTRETQALFKNLRVCGL